MGRGKRAPRARSTWLNGSSGFIRSRRMRPIALVFGTSSAIPKSRNSFSMPLTRRWLISPMHRNVGRTSTATIGAMCCVRFPSASCMSSELRALRSSRLPTIVGDLVIGGSGSTAPSNNALERERGR